MRLVGHLAVNAVRNVIIAAPVGGALGEGELVHIVTIQFAGQHFGGRIDFAGAFHKVAASAVKFDLFDFTFRRAGRHHGDKRQTQQAGKVGFGDGS